MPIDISRERRQEMVASIQRWFADEMDQDFGELKARLVLDFFLEEIGPEIYNGAIADAQAWFRDRVEDLEGSCHATPREPPRQR